MSEPLDHHFVPEFYLKQWARAERQLFEYSNPWRDRIVVRPKYPSATGYQHQLYTLPGSPPEEAQSIEKKVMGDTDNSAAKAHQVLLAGTRELDGRERYAWARFLYAQIFRTPDQLERVGSRYADNTAAMIDNYRGLYDRLRIHGEQLTFDEFKARYLANPLNTTPLNLLDRLLNGPGVLHVAAMHFRIIRLPSGSDSTFLTSDRPFVMTNGLLQPHAHIVIPISPESLFVADNEDHAYTSLSADAPSDLTARVNDRVARQAFRYVYGVDGAQLEFVRGRLGRREQATSLG